MYINRVGSNTILQERSTECTVSYSYTCDLCQIIHAPLELVCDKWMEDTNGAWDSGLLTHLRVAYIDV